MIQASFSVGCALNKEESGCLGDDGGILQRPSLVEFALQIGSKLYTPATLGRVNRDQKMLAANHGTSEVAPAPLWIRLIAVLTRGLPLGKHYAVEWLCRGSDRRFIARVPDNLGAFSFDCSVRDQLARAVYFAGSFEAPELAFLRETLHPGMTFVDVGANWGLFSLFAASRVGGAGKVLAFEPDGRMFHLLRENVKRNRLRQIELFQVAIADRSCEMTLVSHDRASDNWGVSRIATNATQLARFTVPCKPLDAVMDEATLAVVDLVKIDVEGAEDLVLHGMLNGLRKQRYRRILLELHPSELNERGQTMAEVISVLTSEGYKGWAFDHSATGVRRAFYHPDLAFDRYLKPPEDGLNDSHPHTLWIAPGTCFSPVQSAPKLR